MNDEKRITPRKIHEIDDPEHYDATITNVIEKTDDRGKLIGWSVDGVGRIDIPASAVQNKRIRPRVGQTIRYYGQRGGYVRGVAFGQNVAYYASAEQMREDLERRQRERDDVARARFAEVEQRLDERYAALPPVFQARITKFRRTSEEFRWRFEEYEMFCCEQAVRIANLCGGDIPMIETFKSGQREQLPEGIGPFADDNTRGCVVALARAYATDPPYVVMIHGAGSLMYSCERYGCPHPVPVDLIPGGQQTVDRMEREVKQRLADRQQAPAAQ